MSGGWFYLLLAIALGWMAKFVPEEWIGGIIVLVVGLLGASRQARARKRPLSVEYEQVTAKRFVVVNEMDKPVVEVASDETGGLFELRASDGTLRARLRVQENGGIFRLYGPGSTPLVTTGITGNEVGYVRISGLNGRPRVHLTVDADTGLVQVCGSDGTPRSTLRVLPDGGSLRLTDNEGNTRVDLSAEGESARFQILNREGFSHVEMGADEFGGIIGVLGSDGKPRARVRAMEKCGVIRIADENGRVVGELGAENNRGHLKLLDSQGHLLEQIPEPSKKWMKTVG